MPTIIDFDHGISAIDSEFLRPMLDAIHLIVEDGKAAIIDTATNAAVPLVLEALAIKGLRRSDVEYVILTHIHLDHAGGAGLLMQHLPNAKLTVHPRGARHMADPSALIAGTVAVYGEEVARRHYGDIVPVPAGRIVETGEGAVLDLNGRLLQFLETPGHARHHVSIFDETSRSVFAGDTFGVSYRELDAGGREFIFPACTPVQFDPQAAHRSLNRIVGLQPTSVFVTHFSQVNDVPRLAADLHRMLDAYVDLARAAPDDGAEARHIFLREGMRELLVSAALAHGCPLRGERLLEILDIDVELNAQGLAIWLAEIGRPPGSRASPGGGFCAPIVPNLE
jgi:glyoxylase-like metal-dependent hydrolase (beta-lactamase superfamily II)